MAKGVLTMLSLQLKDGEYFTIGDDIVIQVFTNSTIKVSVQAPRDMAILRGEVLERNGGEPPKGLLCSRAEKVKAPISVSSG